MQRGVQSQRKVQFMTIQLFHPEILAQLDTWLATFSWLQPEWSTLARAQSLVINYQFSVVPQTQGPIVSIEASRLKNHGIHCEDEKGIHLPSRKERQDMNDMIP